MIDHALSLLAQHPKPPTSSGVFIILPALNERQNIIPLLDSIHRALTDLPYTVCVVDDGSTDGTIEVISEAMLRNDRHIHLIQREKTVKRSQYGGALRTGREWGLQHTDHRFFVQMDADGSHRPEELREGLHLLEDHECDVAIASKYLPGSRVVDRPLIRRLVSRVANTLSGILVSIKVRDYSNGYRFYTRAAAQVLFEHEIKYSSPIYLTEVLAIWLHNNMRVKEFPSTYLGRNEGISKLSLIDMLIAGVAVFEIGLRYHVSGFTKKPCYTETHRISKSNVE